jgi:hypothetical protein
VAENAHGELCSYKRSSTSSVTRLSGCARCAKAQMVFTFLIPWPVDGEDYHKENNPKEGRLLKDHLRDFKSANQEARE